MNVLPIEQNAYGREGSGPVLLLHSHFCSLNLHYSRDGIGNIQQWVSYAGRRVANHRHNELSQLIDAFSIHTEHAQFVQVASAVLSGKLCAFA